MTHPDAHDDSRPTERGDEPVGCVTVFGAVGVAGVIVIVNVIVCGVVGSWTHDRGDSGRPSVWSIAVISLLELVIVFLALRRIDAKMSPDAVATRAAIAAGCAIAAGLNTICWRMYV